MTVLKRSLFIVCLLSVCFFLTDCERDDICAEETPTTPLLIIQFFDDVTRTDPKSVTNLKVRAADEGAEDFISSETTDSIAIPLKTDALITDYEFTFDTGGDDENLDSLSFQYTTEEEYVSSACGFRVLYRGISRSGPDDDGDTWIDEINIQQSDVINETVTHVFIYH